MTSAPISDCKKALNADGVDGDMDKAVDWLRKNGVATASKKAGRSAAEGVVCVLQSGEPPKSGVIVEVNSETDFVGRNADFTGFVENVAKAALNVTALGSSDDVSWRAVHVSRVCCMLTMATTVGVRCSR